MKTIGLIGGMSWKSSIEYYRIVNEKIQNILGESASCKSLMYSVNFAEVEKLQLNDEWGKLNRLMANAAKKLYNGGADIIVLCTNTMHLCSNAIQDAVPIPFLHIADATGEKVAEKELKKVGLLGAKFTMQKDFYKNILKEKYAVETIIPNLEDQEEIHRIIYNELVLGKITSASKEKCISIIHRLQKNEAEGIILGCTEIPLLISQEDVKLPIFDTMTIHAEKAVEIATKS